MKFDMISENLKKKGFAVTCFETAKEAADYINREVDGKTVGIGGSMTVQEMGLEEQLKLHNEVYWHWDPETVESVGSVDGVRDRAALTEIYLASVNGLSETGELVNIDGTGNRIASTVYGHKKVYFLVGINKLVPSLEKAIWRARNVAAPLNARRLKRKTPCAVHADRCYDCSSPERSCRGMLILERPMASCEMEVVLIGENLGA